MKKRIVFIVYYSITPLEVIKYLEVFHVKVWPKKVTWNNDKSRTCEILVNEKQYLWSAKLIAGYSNQLHLLEPKNIKPTKPKSRWTTNSVRPQGIKSIFIHLLADIFSSIKPRLPRNKKNEILKNRNFDSCYYDCLRYCQCF